MNESIGILMTVFGAIITILGLGVCIYKLLAGMREIKWLKDNKNIIDKMTDEGDR